ncbi:DUF3987 domain-containing protein [Kitasatospora xanthocidica]|uniref:DUF3987 domain-containing protein n=1 Tax=Kitasatospora xanthocidica TaxID=83382 RepID=A0A373A2R3_9ACTN|nr:DUF3987 domain-containing protein [Kitasatospora xanthocidica]RGD62448.1 DUF3987 domain-containing protein [Kitasatospora xanthocidica]
MASADYSGMFTGRLKALVDEFAPQMNWSPIGLGGTLLAVLSAMADDTRVQRGEGSLALPLQVVIVGESGEGKGQLWSMAREIAQNADPVFMGSNVINSVTGGKGLLIEVFGRNNHALVFESEWQRILMSATRNPTLSANIRDLADSVTVAGGTGKDRVVVEDPHVAFLGHIQPEVFASCMSARDASGGSYNRQIFVPIEQENWLSERHRRPPALMVKAQDWFSEALRHSRRTPFLSLTEDALDAADEMERPIRQHIASVPALKPFGARVIEHIRRVAALMCLFDIRKEVNSTDLQAARAFVEYSFTAVEQFASLAANGRGVKTLPDYIREHLVRLGGKAQHSKLVRALGARANAASVRAAVKEMDDIEVLWDESGALGRTAEIYRFRATDQDTEDDLGDGIEVDQAEEETAQVISLPEARRQGRASAKASEETPAEAPAAEPANPLQALL